MQKNVIRLAELLQKEKLTQAEKREGINLAQSMFGTTAYMHRDHVLVALRRKAVVGYNDPTNAVGRATTIGLTNGATMFEAPAAPNKIIDTKDASVFSVGDDNYESHVDAKGRAYFTMNGKRIKASDFAIARADAE